MKMSVTKMGHDDIIKWKHFPRYRPFVRGIHWTPVNSPPKGQWRGALMFSLICDWTNDWANNRGTGDLKRHCAHYNITVMTCHFVAITGTTTPVPYQTSQVTVAWRSGAWKIKFIGSDLQNRYFDFLWGNNHDINDWNVFVVWNFLEE